MIELQFGQVNHIMEAYKNAPRENGDRIIVSHEYGLNYQKTGKDMPYLLMKSSVALNFT